MKMIVIGIEFALKWPIFTSDIFYHSQKQVVSWIREFLSLQLHNFITSWLHDFMTSWLHNFGTSFYFSSLHRYLIMNKTMNWSIGAWILCWFQNWFDHLRRINANNYRFVVLECHVKGLVSRNCASQPDCFISLIKSLQLANIIIEY
jgi:hypothetical protein